MEAVVDHLYGLGHRRIAFVSLPAAEHSGERRRVGLAAALRAPRSRAGRDGGGCDGHRRPQRHAGDRHDRPAGAERARAFPTTSRSSAMTTCRSRPHSPHRADDGALRCGEARPARGRASGRRGARRPPRRASRNPGKPADRAADDAGAAGMSAVAFQRRRKALRLGRRVCARSISTFPTMRSWRCSGLPAAARRRRFASSPGSSSPTGGRVMIGERDVTRLQPRDRDVAMVFQSYALYPHMTVAENIAYPLRIRKVPPARARPARRARSPRRSRSIIC